MGARFYFTVSDNKDKTYQGKPIPSLCNVWISPEHYGRSIESIQKSRTKLVMQIGDDLYQNFDFEEPHLLNANIEIGNTRWDKSVVRVHLQYKLKKGIKINNIKAKLIKRGFYPVPEDFLAF